MTHKDFLMKRFLQKVASKIKTQHARQNLRVLVVKMD